MAAIRPSTRSLASKPCFPIPITMRSEPISPRPLFLFLTLLSTCISSVESKSGDAETLLALKASVDPYGVLHWRQGAAAQLCTGWNGVKECSPEGRVTKLVLEHLNLTGELGSDALSPLDQLRVLSLKSNSLSGSVPDLSSLLNLKSLYLGGNRFSGRIQASLAALHHLKIVALDGNLLSGPIPASFAGIPRLYTLLLQNNRLTGAIPALNQPGLRYFNVSGNALSGEIPETQSLSRFNLSSFGDNPNLCGARIGKPCAKNPSFPPSVSPESSVPSTVIDLPTQFSPASKRRKKKRVVEIVAGCIAGVVLVLICFVVVVVLVWRRKRRRSGGNRSRSVDKSAGGGGGRGGGVDSSWRGGGEGGDGGGGGKAGFSWEGEGEGATAVAGRLEFCGGAGDMYGLEELLRASAETLGRGTVGSTYKAVMETGFIVTVKRLKEAGQPPGAEEFRLRMEELGQLRHPNLVPLRAYFQAKEERLLVYDYFPNGSLFSLIHGSRPSGSGKPLHWTSCLKIGEDVATGLMYLHQSGTVHGNLKSSNVLLGSDFESCLTDYALVPHLLCSPDDPAEVTTAAAALFYRAPESRHPRKPAFTPQSDVYAFGVLLLELLTGKTPFQDLVEQHGADIPNWVRSVREEESTESGGDEATSGNEAAGGAAAEEKLGLLLSIATACVAVAADARPATKEVLRMIREARAEARVSSNSSDHSPGRWSDTVQSLPREYGSEHLSFAERN